MPITRLFLIFILTFPPGVLFSQYLSPEKKKDIVESQIQALTEQSDSIFGKDTRLVNGKFYFPPHALADGHPYFKSADWIRGSVTLNGETFSGVNLNYDIYNDNLIYLDESRGGIRIRILLNKNQVKNFTIEDHTFIRVELPSDNGMPKKQYFEVLYEGKVGLLKKWTKKFETMATQDRPYGRYSDPGITCYIMKDGEFSKITTNSSLIKILDDKKNEINKYIKENRIRVRKATDQQMIGLFRYYDSIAQ